MSTYAVIETGNKQYWVEPKSVIDVELLDLGESKKKEVVLDRVLFVRDGDRIEVGQPVVAGAKVICDFVDEVRGPKVIHFRFRRRKNSKKKHGHRQDYIRLQVREIKAG